MKPYLPLFLAFVVSCQADQTGPPAAEAAMVVTEAGLPDWPARMTAVRAALAAMDKAHQAHDKKSALLAWRAAYRDLFEPGIEDAVTSLHLHITLAPTEYAFGQLLIALDTPNHEDVEQALTRLYSRLDEVESALSAQ